MKQLISSLCVALLSTIFAIVLFVTALLNYCEKDWTFAIIQTCFFVFELITAIWYWVDVQRMAKAIDDKLEKIK